LLTIFKFLIIEIDITDMTIVTKISDCINFLMFYCLEEHAQNYD